MLNTGSKLRVVCKIIFVDKAVKFINPSGVMHCLRSAFVYVHEAVHATPKLNCSLRGQDAETILMSESDR